MIKKIYANGVDEKNFLKEVEARNTEKDKKVSEIVAEIAENVKKGGDKAVKDYTLKFDGKSYKVTLSDDGTIYHINLYND